MPFDGQYAPEQNLQRMLIGRLFSLAHDIGCADLRQEAEEAQSHGVSMLEEMSAAASSLGRLSLLASLLTSRRKAPQTSKLRVPAVANWNFTRWRTDQRGAVSLEMSFVFLFMTFSLLLPLADLAV